MTSAGRLTSRNAGLLVVDVQRKLVDAIPRGSLVVSNAERLIRVARLLEIPVWCTEQYPRGLGETVEPIVSMVPDRVEKLHFHAVCEGSIRDDLKRRGVRHLTLTGLEAHVCVSQTALELMESGYTVQIPADAVASRCSMDWEIAMRRLAQAGAVVTTTEAVLFEWAETADRPEFKEISRLVKDFRPPDETRD